jgi:hypothetical protein
MKKAIDSMTANVFLSPTELTADKLEELMSELIDQKVIEKLLKTRYTMIREMIFALISANKEAEGNDDPTHAPGYVAVPKFNKKFTREGGRLKSVLDDDLLRSMLTEEQIKEVYTEVEIPAKVELKRDNKVLVKMMATNPAVMAAFQTAVTPAGYTNSSFHDRELEEGD